MATAIRGQFAATSDHIRMHVAQVLYQEVINGTYVEEPEIERLMEMRTLIESLNIRVNLLGHHVSNTVPITGGLPDDKAAILREFDMAIAEFPEEELKAYRSRIWHL